MRMSRVFDEILDSAFGADHDIKLTARERSELLKRALQTTDPGDRGVWRMSNHDTLQIRIDPSDVIYTDECPIDWQTSIEFLDDEEDYYTVTPADMSYIINELIPTYPQRILRGIDGFDDSEVIRNLRAVVSDVIEYTE